MNEWMSARLLIYSESTVVTLDSSMNQRSWNARTYGHATINSFVLLFFFLFYQAKVNFKSGLWRRTWGSSAFTPISEQLLAKLTPASFNVTIHNPLPTWFVHDHHKTLQSISKFLNETKEYHMMTRIPFCVGTQPISSLMGHHMTTRIPSCVREHPVSTLTSHEGQTLWLPRQTLWLPQVFRERSSPWQHK